MSEYQNSAKLSNFPGEEVDFVILAIFSNGGHQFYKFEALEYVHASSEI